ncbi:hypothetical protein VTJ49DRAFT_6144 [Mycothermus thermophilus]|uniref:Uncharacterized protein n=1 Tax=Humicola insolens TaxID=85995 RepID=A0ABR3V1T0_HUMIN
MTNRNTRRPSSRWAWWQVLTLATAASAISLSNIQPIEDGASVTLGCTLAYSTDITSCRISDFQRPGVCSAVCVRGLTRAMNAIQAACADADVSPTSLLGRVLAGRVVAVLCPGTFSTTITTTIRSPTPTERPSGDTSTRALTTSTFRNPTSGPLTFTTVRSATTSSSSAEETGIDDGDGDSSTTTARSIVTSQSDTPIPSPTAPSTTPTPSDQTLIPPTDTPSPDANDDEDSGNSSGGGSPFDIVRTSDAPRLPIAQWTAALGLGLLLLWCEAAL